MLMHLWSSDLTNLLYVGPISLQHLSWHLGSLQNWIAYTYLIQHFKRCLLEHKKGHWYWWTRTGSIRYEAVIFCAICGQFGLALLQNNSWMGNKIIWSFHPPPLPFQKVFPHSFSAVGGTLNFVGRTRQAKLSPLLLPAAAYTTPYPMTLQDRFGRLGEEGVIAQTTPLWTSRSTFLPLMQHKSESMNSFTSSGPFPLSHWLQNAEVSFGEWT